MSISVIMSVFNGSAYLEQSLRSVLEQNKEDFEFLIANDGSTDNTLKLINQEVDLSLINFSPRKLKWLKKNKQELNLNFWEQESSNYKYI